jgi:hypothetical protein
MRNDKEYQLSKAIATYLKYQYPGVLYHFDYAGLGLSKAQSGKMKAIQGDRGYPDLFIIKVSYKNPDTHSGIYHGLFIELKADGEKIYKMDGKTPVSEHITEQIKMIERLNKEGYYASFAIGLDNTKKLIDWYLNE